MLPGDPLVPRGFERLAEYLGELARVVRLAPFAALQPFDHGLRRMDVSEVAVEPRTVQVGVGDGLEIRGNALGYQAEVAVEMRVVADHRAEHHFVEGALGPADAPRHPGFHEIGGAFEIPARCTEPRHREVVVEDRLRVFVGRSRFAAEEPPPAQVAGVGDVRVDDVHGFVVHQRVHALAARHRLQRTAGRGDVQHDAVVGRGAGTRVSVVREVGHQHHGLFGRRPVEDLPLELQGVIEGAGDEGRQIGLEGIEVEQLEIVGLELVHLEGSGEDRLGGQQRGDPQARDDG